MNQTGNDNYRTNESVGNMFLHSCLGKLVIFLGILLILFIIAILTKPSDQEMRDEMNDNIMQCMEMNDSIRGDQIDDFVHNIGFIFTKADTTKVGQEWREVFDKQLQRLPAPYRPHAQELQPETHQHDYRA